MNKLLLKFLITCFILFTNYNWCTAQATQKVLVGIVKDKGNEEGIANASVKSLNQMFYGAFTNQQGQFNFKVPNATPKDSLIIEAIGFAVKTIYIPYLPNNDTVFFNIDLDRAKESGDIVVKTKSNRGLIIWKKIVTNKYKYDKNIFKNFSYEAYNKLELDINNLNKKKINDIKFLKPFAFMLNSVDSNAQGKTFLPIYLTETLSNYYYTKAPKRYRETIKASRSSGYENPSISKMMGSMYQQVNIYSNFIPVFDKQFVSPFSDNGDAYYKYRILDTMRMDNTKHYHMLFEPRRKGENTFEGDCWVADDFWAIKKVSLKVGKDANINFLENLNLYQEFNRLPDSSYFIVKDKFYADIYPVGKNKLSFQGKKTTTYKNILVNNSAIVDSVKLNKIKEEIIIANNYNKFNDTFWNNKRHENLTKNEAGVYHMIDTLTNMPLFKRYNNSVAFLGTGYKSFGNIDIGPWYNWVSANNVEGTRVRFDLTTNRGFNKKLILHGYAAYGFTDKRFKGKLEGLYLLSRSPRLYLYAGVAQDYDNGQQYYDEISTDNIFSLAIRKPNVPIKFMAIEQQQIEVFKEWPIGLGAYFTALHKVYEPIRNLPLKANFTGGTGDPLNNFELSIRLRFAYLEKFIENSFYRTSLGSSAPIIDMRFSKGISGVLNSNYSYSKITASISDYIKIAPYGSLYANIYGGKIFGNLPYTMLEAHPGNEIFYYNKYAFNMMNRFEYLSDQFLGANVEHNIGNGIFRLIPITRKLKFRQFWQAKVLWSTLNAKNIALNFVPGHNFKTLNGKPYIEAGTGIDNIFRVLRLDFVWRIAPTPLPVPRYSRFGVFGSFKIGL